MFCVKRRTILEDFEKRPRVQSKAIIEQSQNKERKFDLVYTVAGEATTCTKLYIRDKNMKICQLNLQSLFNPSIYIHVDLSYVSNESPGCVRGCLP